MCFHARKTVAHIQRGANVTCGEVVSKPTLVVKDKVPVLGIPSGSEGVLFNH